MQQAVHDDRAILYLKIKSVFLRAEAIHDMAITLDFPETITPAAIQILFGHMELLQQLKLLQSPQSGDFRRANFIKNDLKHAATLETARPTSTLGIAA